MTDAEDWRRSRRCESGNCVEIAHANEIVKLRDSADPAGPVLMFSRAAWDAFASSVRDGEFDASSH